MAANDEQYTNKIRTELLRKPGEFRAYFRVYHLIFRQYTGDHIISEPANPYQQPLSHDAVLTAASTLKANPKHTPETAVSELRVLLQQDHQDRVLKFAVNLAVQAMLMLDVNLIDSLTTDCSIHKDRRPKWASGEPFVDFVTGSFPRVSTERGERVASVLEDKKSLKAWKLERRLHIIFRGTDNIADHLLFNPNTGVVYLFHHAAYIKAHLSTWSGHEAPKGVGIATALERGTLSPGLLAETLHSLQSILFRYDDERSMAILKRLVRKEGFDESCCVHEGYKIFRDTAEDISYVYWGERLSVLHDLVLNKPPLGRFQRSMRWWTSETNSFLVAMLALAISIIVGILSLGLSAFQAWVAWQAWKYPNQPPGGDL
ncbi:hypothetical protein QBC34DRAFT_406654 [Podospora aff. communis PSN243]|uniref:Uncharacterized protein n=1 Tax=Podospora aff. communis PSN243 TaxID=3040156 RepID=A0AAV9GN41_9PEZI|nr:hypothetical protein QBC34DRAFT_406654 [Podospora aff. communis PSN243]